jgi:hypothetical protein
MNQLKDFFDEERKRVFTPGPFFTERVMARLNEKIQDFGIWELIPGSARPVLGIAVVLLLCFMAVELFIPQLPVRGMVEAVIESEQSPAESFLYSESEVQDGTEYLEQMIALEDLQ